MSRGLNVLLVVSLAIGAPAWAQECGWKLKDFRDTVSKTEKEVQLLVSRALIQDRNLEILSAQTYGKAFGAACPSKLKNSFQKNITENTGIAERTGRLENLSDSFQVCVVYFSTRVRTETAQALKTSSKNRVLRLSAIDKIIRDLSGRTFVLGQRIEFLASKARRLGKDNSLLQSYCESDGDLLDF